MCHRLFLSAENEAGMVTPRVPKVPSNTRRQILEFLQRGGSDAEIAP
jgi:hypothetical protein